ncbi:serine hydrolase domain-containing protein [Acidobacteriota bacterium]
MKKNLAGILILMCLGNAALLFALPQEQDTEAVPLVLEATSSVGLTDAADLETFLDGVMRIHMESRHIAGAVFVAVKDGEIFLSKGYGYADVDGRKPALPDKTLFRPGSVSKLFVWTAVMQLWEQGRIDLDADINTYLRTFQMPDTFPQPITMKDLMRHTPGFEETVLGMAARMPADLVPLGEYLQKNLPERVFPPGEITAYSNYGSALAAYIVEVVSGIPFEEYLERSIFVPLGMENSTFRQPLPDRLSEQMSGGYTYGRGVFTPDDFELINGMYPAGSMSTTAEDLAHFMIAHLQLGRWQEARILDRGTTELMQTRLFAHDARIDGNAHGFWEWEYNGIRILHHGGDTLLFHSFLILLPAHNTGFFVSYNSEGGGGPSRMQLMEAVLDRYFPSEAPPEIDPPAGFTKRAGRFSGLYMMSRVNHSSFLKLMQLAVTVKVRATREGTLLIGNSDPKQYVEIEPLVFRELGRQDLVVFKEDSGGRITHMYLGRVPHMACIKMAWHQFPSWHILILAVTGFFFLSTLIWPLSALRRKLCKYSEVPADAPRAARLLAGGMSVVCLVFLIGMVAVFSRPDSVMFGVPLLLKILLVLPFAAAVLALGVLFYALMSWIKGYWYACSRIHYLFIFLAFLGFLWLLYHWNLLGFHF